MISITDLWKNGRDALAGAHFPGASHLHCCVRGRLRAAERAWCVLALSLICLTALLPVTVEAAAKGKPKKAAAADAFFASSEVLKISIEAPEKAVATLREYHWQFGTPATNRESVQVTVREGQTVYTNVALHLKGAAGSFRPVDENPAMTLNFDKFADGQHFHGLTKLSLNNSVQDPTFVSEQLCRELFLKAGVPTPRATHALVELNGRDLGLYVLTEGWDRDFLKRHFKNTKGNLYDGGFLKDVTETLSTNSGDDPKNQSDRIALVDAAKEKNLTNRLARLEKVLDIERFLTFVALEVMLWDWDGYPLNRNNWRLYHDLDKDRMVFLPHGLDQMFWKPEGPILPPMQGLVAKAALQIPELRRRYLSRIQELRASVFQPEVITNRAYQIAAKFTPLLSAKSPGAAKEHQKALTDWCEAIMRRGRSMDEQLRRPIEPPKFNNAGLARLDGWEPKSDFGFPLLSASPSQGTVETIEIGTKQGSSIGSWRSKVWLEQGRYRVEGRLKTEGIVADPGDPRAGAGFRTGRNRPADYLLGNSDWKRVEHEFSVDSLTEIVVVCEFRGAKGKAVFDLESLRLKRLDNPQ